MTLDRATIAPDDHAADSVVSSAVVDAAHTALTALDLDVGSVEGGTRVLPCTDSLGAETDERLARYSSGSSMGSDSLTDEQITALVDRLGVEFIEDSVDLLDVRSVGFFLSSDGVDVLVRVVLEPDGSATLTASTACG